MTAKNTQKREFKRRDKDDDRDFAGSLYMRNGKTYNLELPNGDAVSVHYWLENRQPTLQVISSNWCEKTALDVQASENKCFKPNGEYKPAKLSKKTKQALAKFGESVLSTSLRE